VKVIWCLSLLVWVVLEGPSKLIGYEGLLMLTPRYISRVDLVSKTTANITNATEFQVRFCVIRKDAIITCPSFG
jgi:hypothetical protein